MLGVSLKQQELGFIKEKGLQPTLKSVERGLPLVHKLESGSTWRAS